MSPTLSVQCFCLQPVRENSLLKVTKNQIYYGHLQAFVVRFSGTQRVATSVLAGDTTASKKCWKHFCYVISADLVHVGGNTENEIPSHEGCRHLFKKFFLLAPSQVVAEVGRNFWRDCNPRASSSVHNVNAPKHFTSSQLALGVKARNGLYLRGLQSPRNHIGPTLSQCPNTKPKILMY